MTNKTHSTLYIGVTSDLPTRIIQHRSKLYPNSFTAKYNLNECIYFEFYPTIEEAINREKQIKRWNRGKKERLIKTLNPNKIDLAEEILNW